MAPVSVFAFPLSRPSCHVRACKPLYGEILVALPDVPDSLGFVRETREIAQALLLVVGPLAVHPAFHGFLVVALVLHVALRVLGPKRWSVVPG